MRDQDLIQNTLNIYSLCAGLRDWDRQASTYAPEGAWEVTHLGLRFEGRDNVHKALLQFSSAMEYVQQLNSPAVIEVRGDSAVAECSIRECGKYVGRNEGFEFLGIYVDRLRRFDDGWKFTERVFKVVGTHDFQIKPTQKWNP
jgi:hypothetical protein